MVTILENKTAFYDNNTIITQGKSRNMIYYLFLLKKIQFVELA